MARVTVWPHRAIKGWDGDGDHPVGTRPTTLFEALDQQHTGDAHFVPYVLVGQADTPRVNKAALASIHERGWYLQFWVAVLDIDCPEAHKGDGRASDEWREQQADLYEDLPGELYQGLGVYHTRGGYRMLWRLPEPLDEVQYLATVGKLRKAVAEHGIEADKLTDWGRCYRLPKVRRDGEWQDYASDYAPMQVACLSDVWVAGRADEGGTYDGIEGAGERREALEAPERITENRNTTLFRLAGSWRRTGLGEEEILRMLGVINETRCEPPLDDEELTAIARSVMRYAPEEPPPGAPADVAGGGPVWAPPQLFLGDEVELATAVATDLEGDGERLVFDRSRLWAYADGVWSELEPHKVHNQVHAYSGAQIAAGRDREGNPRFRPLKVSSRFAGGVRQVLQSERTVTGWFDTAPEGVPFSDKFVSVDKGGSVLVEDIGPQHRQTSRLPFEFEPGAFPWAFNKALHDCWHDDNDVEDKVQALREWVGSALLGIAGRYQKALVMVGEGANGKSTIQEIVSALFPEGTVVSIPPQDMEQEYRRAALATARLNSVAELPEADILQSEAVKAMVSGDLLTARHIREAPFQFRPRCAHMFSANTLPAVRDMSHGFWRRWMVLPFQRVFEAHEQDRGLAGRIIADELGSIASWCIEGAAELVSRGAFEEPQSSVITLAQWRHDADQVSMFIEERAERCEDYETTASDLYTEYCTWVVTSGHRRMSRTKFGQRIKSLGVACKRSSVGRVYALRLA